MGETQGTWFPASLWPRLKCQRSPTARPLSLSGGDAGAGGGGLRHHIREEVVHIWEEVVHIWSLSIQEVEAGGSGNWGHPWLPNKF